VLLEDYGFEPHLVHPLQCKAIASARLKNDKAGAATLAQLVRLRTLLRNRIHAVLADHGHGRPQGCWSGPGRRWLAALQLPAVSREVIEATWR
jgi:transposase